MSLKFLIARPLACKISDLALNRDFVLDNILYIYCTKPFQNRKADKKREIVSKMVSLKKNKQKRNKNGMKEKEREMEATFRLVSDSFKLVKLNK